MPLHITIPHPVLQPQVPSAVPTSPAFNANPGTISEKIVLTTIALTATGQPLAITNQFAQNGSVDYAKRRDISSPTTHLTMTGTIMMSSRTRDMLGTELVTQGNEGGSVTVFLSFLSSPYELIISPSTYGHNITWSPMWLLLTHLISDSLWLGHYSTSRQFFLGAVPHVPTHPFTDTLALVLINIAWSMCRSL